MNIYLEAKRSSRIKEFSSVKIRDLGPKSCGIGCTKWLFPLFNK